MDYQKDLDAFYDSINVDYAAYVANTLSQFGSNETLGFRMAGSEAELAAGHFLYQEFNSIGLKNVRKEKVIVDSWEFKNGELYYLDQKNTPQKITLSAYASNCIHENKTFDLVYVGKGTKKDYENIDVKGKLVLIDLDSYIGCQIGICALQARQKGAYGIIAAPINENQKLPADALTYENFTAPADIPAFSISLKDAYILKTLLIQSPSSKISVILNCYSKVSPDSTSYNIIGEIPGRNPNDIILVMSHYDGLFHNFHSGACGCGLLLSLARALINSHYIPSKTIIFIAHSAKEWGLTNSSFNWSIGGYQQITKNHPEWAEKAFVAINLEGFVAHDEYDYHHIRTAYEYKELVNAIQKIVTGCPYKQGCLIDAPTTILSDDFAYSQSGVPTIISYRPINENHLTTYQTNYDLIHNHFSRSAFEYCHKLYGTIIILFDQMKIKPFNFEKLFHALEESLDFESYHHYKELYFLIHDAKWCAKNLYEFTQRNHFTDSEAKYINQQLHYLYLMIQQSFVRLSWYGANIFPHEAHQENILHLREAIRLLKKEKLKSAVEQLCRVDLNLYAFYFDKKTYQFYIHQSCHQDDEHLTWGRDLLLSELDLYDIIETLQRKHSWEDIYVEIQHLKEILKEEEFRQEKVIEEEMVHLKQIIDWMRSLYRRP